MFRRRARGGRPGGLGAGRRARCRPSVLPTSLPWEGPAGARGGQWSRGSGDVQCSNQKRFRTGREGSLLETPGRAGAGQRRSGVQGCSPLPPPLPQAPGFRGVRTRPDPAHKAAPVTRAIEPRRAACGRVTGGRPAPAEEDVPGSRSENSPSWGGWGGASGARELGAGGRFWHRRWAPAKAPESLPLRGRRAGPRLSLGAG